MYINKWDTNDPRIKKHQQYVNLVKTIERNLDVGIRINHSTSSCNKVTFFGPSSDDIDSCIRVSYFEGSIVIKIEAGINYSEVEHKLPTWKDNYLYDDDDTEDDVEHCTYIIKKVTEITPDFIEDLMNTFYLLEFMPRLNAVNLYNE